MENNKYSESLDFLFSQLPMFSRVGAPAYKPGLDTSLQLDSFFNHPHRKFKSIHIGGTNGKGSTSHMLASVLASQGYKTGLYTSPHLVDFRERMRINGEMIPEENVIEFVEQWRKNAYEGKPSFFELTMMMAFDWFAKERVDFAIIEVGMGGRLDSTNIITPLLSVITNISHDHNQFLGSTLEEIAGEKAGIIKKGVPVVIGEHSVFTDAVFISKAQSEGSELIFAPDVIKAEIKEEGNGGYEVKSDKLKFKLPLGGEYQKKNILTVLASIKMLKEEGVEISDKAIKDGIENVEKLTGLAGRWMKLSESPLVIADTGHNVAGLEYNFTQLEKLMSARKCGKLRIVIGFVADKAIDKILPLLPEKAKYYVTNASIPRALGAEELFKIINKTHKEAEVGKDVASAYEAAQREASEEDVIFVGGSTFIVADLLAYLKGNKSNA